MRRYSHLFRNFHRTEMHSSIIKSRRRLFINFERKAFTLFQKKYSNPYIYKAVPEEDLMTIKNESVPTLFGYYKILKLCNNIPCHYTSIFKDITIFSNTFTEYIQFFFSLSESNLFIKYTIYNVCYYLSNNFPSGNQINKILSLYRNKISTINKNNLKKALGIKDIKKEPVKKLDEFIDEPLENLLLSLYKEQSKNNSKINDDNIKNKNKGDKRGNLNDSISSIEHLIQNIKGIETQKKIQEKKKKLILIDEKNNRRKSIIHDFKESKISKKFVRLRTLKLSKRSLKVNLNTNRDENEEEESEEQNFNIKFKSTFDFITNIREKKKYEQSKTQIIKDCIGLMKNKKKKKLIINYPEKIMQGHYKIFSENIIGVNDVFENERQLFLANRTNNLLRKVKKKKEQDEKRIKKKWEVNSLISYPNIYYNENYNKTNLTIQPKSKIRLNKNFVTKNF